jgi:hypothetical protein
LYIYHSVFVTGTVLLKYRLKKYINDIETKTQTFRYRSLLSEQKQKIMIWSACYGNESRTFQSVPKLFKIETERFGDFLKFKNETRTKPS